MEQTHVTSAHCFCPLEDVEFPSTSTCNTSSHFPLSALWCFQEGSWPFLQCECIFSFLVRLFSRETTAKPKILANCLGDTPTPHCAKKSNPRTTRRFWGLPCQILGRCESGNGYGWTAAEVSRVRFQSLPFFAVDG